METQHKDDIAKNGTNDKRVYSPIKIPDYRISRPAIFLEKGGDTVMSVQQATSLVIGKSKIAFPTPNPVTLFYSKAWKEYEAAEKIYKELIQPNLVKDKTYEVSNADLPMVYDYLEHIQASIISIYSATEAMSNVAIPNDFTLTKKNNKGVTETWNKENIERWLSTTEKIGKIVPGILNIASPSSEYFWKDFLLLKDIRDDIIHQKQSKTNPDKIEEAFLNVLFSDTIFIKIMAGFALIKYFCEKDKTHLYFPILDEDIPVTVNIVDSFPFDGNFTFGEGKTQMEGQ